MIRQSFDEEPPAEEQEVEEEPASAEEAPLEVEEITPTLEIAASSLDAIGSTISHVPSVSRGGAAPSGFGVTRSSVAMENAVITHSGTTFTLTADFVQTITWQVRSGTGPAGQRDIANERDSDITHTNYPNVVRDLTPDMSSDNGRPPRTNFWAEDLTERHEIFHTRQRSGPFGNASAVAIKNWLDGQTATTAAGVRALLPAALNEGVRVFNAFVAAPTTEGDAYADGAPLYQARADAIQRRGDLGLYALGDFPVPDPNGPRFA